MPQSNNFLGSRHSLDKARDYSYDEVLPQISQLQQVYGAPQSRGGRLSQSTSVHKEKL